VADTPDRSCGGCSESVHALTLSASLGSRIRGAADEADQVIGLSQVLWLQVYVRSQPTRGDSLVAALNSLYNDSWLGMVLVSNT
jgi:hypothetical protein